MALSMRFIGGVVSKQVSCKDSNVTLADRCYVRDRAPRWRTSGLEQVFAVAGRERVAEVALLGRRVFLLLFLLRLALYAVVVERL